MGEGIASLPVIIVIHVLKLTSVPSMLHCRGMAARSFDAYTAVVARYMVPLSTTSDG